MELRNIIKVFTSFEDSKQLYLVMESGRPSVDGGKGRERQGFNLGLGAGVGVGGWGPFVISREDVFFFRSFFWWKGVLRDVSLPHDIARGGAF